MEHPRRPLNGTRRDRQTRAKRAAAFRSATSEYQQYRPDYPATIADLVVGYATSGRKTNEHALVVDVGAGTGKFTQLLANRGLDIIAVEPAEAMLAQLKALLPQVRTILGKGEDIGLPDSIADTVVYAQSWHWVEAPQAASEAARILRPHGHLILVWNQLDVAIPWVHRLTRIMRSGDVHPIEEFIDLSPYFEPPDRSLERFEQLLTPHEIMALARTRSSYLRASGTVRERMQENLRWYLYEHLEFTDDEPVTLPYTCVAWSYRRRERCLHA